MQTFLLGLSPAIISLLLWIIAPTVCAVVSPVSTQDVRAVCQAQCMATCDHINAQSVCHNQCVGPPETSMIPESNEWVVDCTRKDSDQMDCVGTCATGLSIDPYRNVPAIPDVTVTRGKSKTIIVGWKSYNNMWDVEDPYHVVSHLKRSSGKDEWETIAIVRGLHLEVGPREDLLCSSPVFKVAAVNTHGSRWFSNATGVPVNIPGRPRNIHLVHLQYQSESDNIIYVLGWQPPSGWDANDIRKNHQVHANVRCMSETLGSIYIFADKYERTENKDGNGDDFYLMGRIPTTAIGCKITFDLRARSRCDSNLSGPPEQYTLDLKCSDVMEYKGEYCTNPPVLHPGPVSELKLVVIPTLCGVMGLVSWQPPKDMGSAGTVAEYHVFYGIVNTLTAGMIKVFEGSPEHMIVAGETHAADIFLNITRLEKFETIGVMVRAAGPGQIIKSPFGDIIYASNDPNWNTRASQLVVDDKTVIVIGSSDKDEGEDLPQTGIGVEIFWRRHKVDEALDIVNYVVKMRTISNATDGYDEVFGEASTRTTNGV